METTNLYTIDSQYVAGQIKKGYEPVFKQFEDSFYQNNNRRAQLCVYVGNEIVIDLYGPKDTEAYSADHIQCVMSSSKVVSSILMAILVDKGLIQYDDTIAKHWPEFGQNGKDKTTIADLMRHEAGLPKLHEVLKPEDLLTENIKQNSIGKIIETDTQVFPTGNPRIYHALTRGWIENEIFRRVFPGGLTMGEFLRQEVNPDHGINIVCGAKEEEFEKLVYFEALGGYQTFKNLWKGPEKAPVGATFGELAGAGKLMEESNKKKDEWFTGNKAREAMEIDFGTAKYNDMIKFFDGEMTKKPFQQGETPSASMNSSARSLAKLGAFMANKGSLQEKQLISEQTWDDLHSEP